MDAIHELAPTWSETDIMKLLVENSKFIEAPHSFPIESAKWGTKSSEAVMRLVNKIRAAGERQLAREFRDNPLEWTAEDMTELTQAIEVNYVAYHMKRNLNGNLNPTTIFRGGISTHCGFPESLQHRSKLDALR